MCQCKKRDKYEVCPDCTLSTKYLVFDGKFVGPNKHAIDHLDEEDHEDNDGMEGHEDTLTQSTLFKNRVFIACKEERSKVLQLVSGEIEMKDFISAEMTSRNGALLQELVEYLADSFVNLPEEYSNFLKNISKAYAVSSLIQVQT